jgi:hypothetical protein
MSQGFNWSDFAEAVAVEILGPPNAEMSRPPGDARFGAHGSVSVNYTTGQWYDHENKRGGGVKELIRVYKEIDDRDAAIAYAEGCQERFENRVCFQAEPRACAATNRTFVDDMTNWGLWREPTPKQEKWPKNTYARLI